MSTRYVVLGVSRRADAGHFLHLMWALVRRDVVQRYRRSLLGPAWAILQPLILMVIFSVIRGVANIPSNGVPYLIFSYAALVPWTFFTNAVVFCGPSVYLNSGILKKVRVPREVFPMAAVTTALFDLAMSSIVLVGMLAWYHMAPSWVWLWVIPLTAVAFALATAVGMLIAALGSYKRDLIMATPFLLQFWLFLTPVIYPLSSVPADRQNLMMLNPMTGVVEGFRSCLLHGAAPATRPLLASIMVTAILLAVTLPLYRRFAQYFADVM